MNEKFRIPSNVKKLIFELEDVLNLFPKKEYVLKDNIEKIGYEILELIFYANIIENKKDIQKVIISKISMLDFYLEIAFKRKYLSEKQVKKLCNSLSVISKMMYGWIKNEREN